MPPCEQAARALLFGAQRIGVSCLTIRLHDVPEAEAQEQVRQAGAQFRAILERVTIEAR